jgi:WD40 repeat protein
VWQDIYAVNDIAFHPVHGTLATLGSDGSFSFWDKDARTKLKPSEPLDQPLTTCAFNHNGQIFAYAAGYDWSKVSLIILSHCLISYLTSINTVYGISQLSSPSA